MLFSSLFSLYFLFLLVGFIVCQSSDDSFVTRLCTDSVKIGSLDLGRFCFTYTIVGCQSSTLNLVVTRETGHSSTPIDSATLSKDSSYTFGGSFLGASCDGNLRIPPLPWILTPTYAKFAIGGSITCDLPIIAPRTITIDQRTVEVGEDCSAHQSCVSCLNSGRCGWCESGAGPGIVNKMCTAERKNETQPYCYQCGQWIFNQVETCPGYVPPTTVPPSSTGGGGSANTAGSGESKDHTAKAVGIAVAVAVSMVALGAFGVFCYVKRRPKYSTTDGGVEMRDGEPSTREESLNYVPPQRMPSSSIVDQL